MCMRHRDITTIAYYKMNDHFVHSAMFISSVDMYIYKWVNKVDSTQQMENYYVIFNYISAHRDEMMMVVGNFKKCVIKQNGKMMHEQ